MKNFTKKRLLSYYLIVVLVVLSGCDSFSGKSEVEVIKERSQQRWDAVLKNDFHTVYEFATPAYRKSFSKNHFFAQYGGQVNRTKVKVLKVEVNPEDKNEAKVVTELFFFAMDEEMSSFEHNTWKKVNGKWWFVELK